MSRRKRVYSKPERRDARYDSPVVAKLVSKVMHQGKRALAERIVYAAIDRANESVESVDPVEVLNRAVENAKPRVEVKSRRVGGATYQVPVEVRPIRRNSLAMRWLIDAARKRSEKSMEARLAGELIDASESKGSAVKKKEDTHRMAEANKAFSHYRW